MQSKVTHNNISHLSNVNSCYLFPIYGGPIELLLSCTWDSAYIKDPLLLIGKSSLCSDGSRFPLLLSEWFFIICLML